MPLQKGETASLRPQVLALMLAAIGRSFTEEDGPGAQHVAIVNQAFTRKLFHGANRIGRYVDKNTMIVGVVEDVAIAPGLVAGAPLTGCERSGSPGAKIGATRRDLDRWMETLPQPRMVAREATIFTGWIYDHLRPHAQQVKVGASADAARHRSFRHRQT